MKGFFAYLILFLLGSSVGFIFIAVGKHAGERRREQRARERMAVPGRIIGVSQRKQAVSRVETVIMYFPVIEYTVGDRMYRPEAENGVRDPHAITVGEPVEVMADPEDPAHFHLAADDISGKGAKIMIGAGVIWVTVLIIIVGTLLFLR